MFTRFWRWVRRIVSPTKGNQVEVGDKQLELLDEEPLPAHSTATRPLTLTSGGVTFTSSASEGSNSTSPSPSRTPTPSGQTTRRQLPPTPGVPILPVPPRKPQRLHHKRISADSISQSGTLGVSPVPAPQTVKAAGKDALKEWCRVQLPNSEHELLQQTKNPEQDPQFLVQLCLQLLRALSHIPGSVQTMVENHIATAVLGSMAVYREDSGIQSFCLDILAKVATRQQKLWEASPQTLEPEKNANETTQWKQNGGTAKNSQDLIKNNKSLCLTNKVKASSDGEDSEVYRLNVDENGSEEPDNSSFGILKKARSYENLRTPDRRVSFVYEDGLVAHSSGTSSSSSSGLNSPTKDIDSGEQGGQESPDIQILSRSIIVPTQLSLRDSSDGEAGPTQSESSTTSDHPPFSLSHVDYGPAPPKPARRPIGPPLVHINSQSTDTEENLDSPPPPPLPERTRLVSPNRHNGLNEDDEGQTVYSAGDELHGYFPDRIDSPNHMQSSVDLANFRYSAADIMFMKRLLSVQVTCQVCAASARGQGPHALKMINMPLDVLLNQSDIPRCLAQFFKSQYTVGTTLMDVDPSTVISVIDAVRYEVLVFDLVRSSLEVLIESLSDKLSVAVVAAGLEVMASARHNPSLARVYSDTEFLQRVRSLASKVRQTVKDDPDLCSSVDALLEMFGDNAKPGETKSDSS
ncbi:hypothetical protein ElyMa_005649700 [Elysia marginata]|uniref:Katanin p80 subunit C-terminal domain-containing protein n=1 Tax=Elysia marginata TaxID=1093978 RepID=A0AAV4FBW4_9GAST|nr:hypothetical protein ElyMa_005649700 [Elysia marginata]